MEIHTSTNIPNKIKQHALRNKRGNEHNYIMTIVSHYVIIAHTSPMKLSIFLTHALSHNAILEGQHSSYESFPLLNEIKISFSRYLCKIYFLIKYNHLPGISYRCCPGNTEIR